MKKKFPEEFIDIATKHGQKRCDLNAAKRKVNPEYDGEKAFEMDFIGVLGELVAQYYLQTKGHGFRAAPLIANDSQAGPDLIVPFKGINHFIDVKATQRSEMKVSLYKHQKTMENTNITHYWFFKINVKSCTFYCHMVKAKSINQWEKKQLFDKYWWWKKFELKQND